MDTLGDRADRERNGDHELFEQVLCIACLASLVLLFEPGNLVLRRIIWGVILVAFVRFLRSAIQSRGLRHRRDIQALDQTDKLDEPNSGVDQ